MTGDSGARRALLDRDTVLTRARALVQAVRADNTLRGYGRASNTFADLRDLDSFSLLELGLALEDEFGVSLEDFEFNGQTLDEVVDYVLSQERSSRSEPERHM